MGGSFNRDIVTTLSLYDSLIKPILTYASDFWGSLKLPNNNPIEVLHMKVLKTDIGCPDTNDQHWGFPGARKVTS